MNKILGKLINLKTKLNQIKIKKKRSTKLLKLKKLKPKIMCKTESKNKYLLFMNDYYKNKLLLNLNLNKSLNIKLYYRVSPNLAPPKKGGTNLLLTVILYL